MEAHWWWAARPSIGVLHRKRGPFLGRGSYPPSVRNSQRVSTPDDMRKWGNYAGRGFIHLHHRTQRRVAKGPASGLAFWSVQARCACLERRDMRFLLPAAAFFLVACNGGQPAAPSEQWISSIVMNECKKIGVEVRVKFKDEDVEVPASIYGE